jgi:hypothetical protein
VRGLLTPSGLFDIVNAMIDVSKRELKAAIVEAIETAGLSNEEKEKRK